MSPTAPELTSEAESRKVAEEARETEWAGRGFLRQLFLGNLELDLIHPFPVMYEERPEFTRFYNEFKTFLLTEVDSVAIDEQGEYPEAVLNGIAYDHGQFMNELQQIAEHLGKASGS